MKIAPGATDVSVTFDLGQTGIPIADLDLYYVRPGEARSAKSDMTALAAVDAAHSDNKGYEIGGNLYRIDPPDAPFAVGAAEVTVTVEYAGESFSRDIELSGVAGLIEYTGTVTSDGDVVVGALVQLFNNADMALAHLIYSAQTDAAGVFVIYAAAGTLQRRVSHPSYQTVGPTEVVVVSGMSAATIELTAVASTGATFDATLPADLDRVRLLLGDTDTTAALLADTTITAMLALYSFREAVAQLAQGLISEFAQMPDSIKTGSVTIDWKSRVDAWGKLVIQVRSGSAGVAVALTTIQAQKNGSETSTVAENAQAAMGSFRSD